MKILIALCLCGLSMPLAAQTELQTFTSPDGIFQFRHSDVLVDCMTERSQANSTTSGTPQVFVGSSNSPSLPESCMSQDGMCGYPGSEASTIACYSYPKDEFTEKPVFVAAAFFVAEFSKATSKKACLERSPYWNVEGVESTTINGVGFKVFHSGGGGLGGYQDDYFYRTFHHGKCYELGIQTATSSPGNFDPETIDEFTKEDNDEVQGRLKQALSSFSFVK